MTATSTTPAGGFDALFLTLGQASILNPVCTGTYCFKGKMTKEKVIDWSNFQQTRFPKYRQKLLNTGSYIHGPVWIDDPNFQTANHISVKCLPGNAGRREFEEAMGELIASPWDYSRPLWDCVLFENYHDDEGAESALITRAHHAMGDGQGFVISQLYCTSFREELIRTMDAGATKLHEARTGTARPSTFHPALRKLDFIPDSSALRPFVVFFMFLLFHLVLAFSAITSFAWSIYMAFHTGTLFLLTSWRIIKLTADQTGPRVSEREFATSKRFAMKDIKTIQKGFSTSKRRAERGIHVTVNDVMVAVTGDVLSSFVRERRKNRSPIMRFLDTILPNRISIFIPISLREPGDWDLRNLSTGAIAYLPESLLNISPSVSDLRDHIHAVKSELDILKHASLPSLAYSIGEVAGSAPIAFPVASPSKIVRVLTRALALFCMQSFQAILTNVPGPASHPVTFQGIEVIRWIASPPQAGKGTLAIGVISYAGTMCISISADKVAKEHGVASRICEMFEERFGVYLAKAKEHTAYE